MFGKRNLDSSLYGYLADPHYRTRAMNHVTIFKLQHALLKSLSSFDRALELASCFETLSRSELKELHDLLPFPFSTFKDTLKLSDSCFSNYTQRGLPQRQETPLRIKSLLLDELTRRRTDAVLFLKTLYDILFFNWDEIVSIEEEPYRDYIYDFVVPTWHNFIGGSMPTVLHNTQIGHQLAVTAQLPKEKGGAGGVVVYLDTEGTARPERIKQMAEALGLDPTKVLRNIKFIRALNSDHQMLIIQKIGDLVTKEHLPVKLVVIDSLMSHFRSEFVGRGTLADRQQKLNKHMHDLLRLAETYNLAVYVTNQVMARPDVFFGDPTAAVGGHIVAHASSVRVYVRKGKKGTRVARIIDAPHLPDSECTFIVNVHGVRDVE